MHSKSNNANPSRRGDKPYRGSARTLCYRFCVLPESRTIIFGAFDRHNFGDMLFAHIAAKELGDRNVVFAGIVERDLTQWGGHRVEALQKIARDTVRTDLIVAGGEVLTCPAWQAAVMVLPPEQAAQAAIQWSQPSPERDAWAAQVLGTSQLAPYVPSKSLIANPGRLIYNAVGGVDFADLDPAMKSEVVAALKSADSLSVRDRVTQAALAAGGVASELAPDCAVRVKELFGDVIAEHGSRGEPAVVREKFPNGYLAVQFSTDCGDDATLDGIARQIEATARDAQVGVVFFRAGIAPWHDELEPYRRAASRLSVPLHIYESAHLWDICAVIAQAKVFLGTSLHGWIVAEVYGIPRWSLVQSNIADTGKVSKQQVYCEAWTKEPLDSAAGGIEAALK